MCTNQRILAGFDGWVDGRDRTNHLGDPMIALQYDKMRSPSRNGGTGENTPPVKGGSAPR